MTKLFSQFSIKACGPFGAKQTRAALAIATILLSAPAFANGWLTGKVTHIRDGDTIEVEGQAVRLAALDCPERRDPAGTAATRLMKQLASGQTAKCELDGSTSYDRVVGYCSVRGRDLGQQMIDADVCGIYQRYNTQGRY